MVAARTDLHRRRGPCDVADRRRGINLAVQDAVAAANRLTEPLRGGVATDADLQAIEERRSLPVRFTQRLQLTIQRRIISRVLESEQRPKPPLVFKLFGVFPFLRRVPAWLIGVGIRPEHVHTPEAARGAERKRGCDLKLANGRNCSHTNIQAAALQRQIDEAGWPTVSRILNFREGAGPPSKSGSGLEQTLP